MPLCIWITGSHPKRLCKFCKELNLRNSRMTSFPQMGWIKRLQGHYYGKESHMAMYGVWDLTRDYMELQWFSKDRCYVLWSYLHEHKYCHTYKDLSIHCSNKLIDVCCPSLKILWSTRWSSGVTILYKKELHHRVHVVHKDVDVHYMWVWTKLYLFCYTCDMDSSLICSQRRDNT